MIKTPIASQDHHVELLGLHSPWCSPTAATHSQMSKSRKKPTKLQLEQRFMEKIVNLRKNVETASSNGGPPFYQ